VECSNLLINFDLQEKVAQKYLRGLGDPDREDITPPSRNRKETHGERRSQLDLPAISLSVSC